MIMPNALVMYGDGINCDDETASALELANFKAQRLHVSDLLATPMSLFNFQLLAIPGGFSFGDEIASGKILAIKLKERLKDILYRFISEGNLVLGVCNGFQVLVQLGLLPDSNPGAERTVSLIKNSGGKFINRWVDLVVNPNTPCHFFAGLETIQLPIRHGEGRLVHDISLAAEKQDWIKQHAPLRYIENVNGSFDNIAALTNAKGNVLGLMPHPEAYVTRLQHPNWTGHLGQSTLAVPYGLSILINAGKTLCQA